MSNNKETIRRYYEEVFNQGKLEVLDEIVARDHVEHNPLPGQTQGLDGLRNELPMVPGPFTPRLRPRAFWAAAERGVAGWTNGGPNRADGLAVLVTGRT